MKTWTRPEQSSFASAIRLNRMLLMMDESSRDNIYELMREIEQEVRVQQAVDQQLEAELQAEIYRDHRDGTENSVLFQMLPAEIRSHIFSYVVAVEQSVHVFPPKGNESHGFRLSLCDESSYDLESGCCRCDGIRPNQSVRPEFFNNAIFLVSRSVRRQALDAFFMTNKFTFTCLYELVRFTSMFSRSSSRIQKLRIFERVDDYPASEYRLEGIQNARRRLKGLKHLDLHLFIASWSAYEQPYEDGLVDQLLHFALGPQPKSKQQPKKRKLDLEADSDGEVYIVDTKKVDTGNIKDKDQAEHAQAPAPNTENAPTIEVCPESQVSNTAKGKEKAMETSPGQSLHLFNNAQTSTTSASSTLSSAAIDLRPAFTIPPLRSFTPNVHQRSHQILQYRLNRTPDPKQPYYDALCERLSKHLADVFMDAGKKYRTFDEIPKLGEKPKAKVRDDERPLRGTEKRGILFMKD